MHYVFDSHAMYTPSAAGLFWDLSFACLYHYQVFSTHAPLLLACSPLSVDYLYCAGVRLPLMWLQARLERLESGLYTGASGCSGKAYLPTQDAETPASKGGRAAPMSLRRRSEDQVRSAFTATLIIDFIETCWMGGVDLKMKLCVCQESAWKLERERVYRDKAALQRECKALLERLKEYEAAVSYALQTMQTFDHDWLSDEAAKSCQQL